MTRKQFKYLRAFEYAKRHAPKSTLQGRRAVKGKAMHYGIPLKRSHIYSMSVESQPFQRPYHHA